MYENRADNLSNNLRLTEISMLIFFQFYCKIKRNLFEIVAEALMVYTHTNTFRGDTYMSSTLRGEDKNEILLDARGWGGGRGGEGGLESDLDARSSLFLLKKIEFAPWPDIMLIVY